MSILNWLLLLISALAQDALIQVNAAHKATHKIPRSIYGTFLEPIGNSINNGLWAQIIENPSFEDGLWDAAEVKRKVDANPAFLRPAHISLPLPWEPLKMSQGARYEPRWNDAPNSYRWLMLMALPGSEQTGVRQEVYLPVHRVLEYRGSIYMRHFSGAPSVEISIRRRNRPEEILARGDISLHGSEWARYEFKLVLPPGRLASLEAADFVIAAKDNTRVGLDQVVLWPADAVDGMDPEMVKLSRELKTPIVRYGGNYTSFYHWRDGVGPMDKRVSMTNLAWGMPEYNQFGTDEFLAFCRLIHAEPQIALNLGTGTADEAAAWVRYVDRKWNNGKGGLLWELGNELWGNFQHGYPTEPYIAGKTREFSEAVRKVDAGARLIGTGADADHFEKWNAAQLSNPPGTVDLLSTHFVVGTGRVIRKDADADTIALAAFALPVELERRLRRMQQQIDTTAHRGRVHLAFTEWLFHPRNARSAGFNNMGGAICTGGMLNTLMRTSDIVPVSDMTGLIEFGGIWKKRGRVYGVPAYWAFRMFSTADASMPVEIQTQVEKYDVTQGIDRLPEIGAVPYLDVTAALNDAGDKLTLFCVNRHLNKDIRARVELAGFAGAAAKITTLAASNIYAANDELAPENVLPVETHENLAGQNWTHAFPRSSVTVIEIQRQLN
ncbi:MAG TPA: hypothetical protein DEQ47_20405 [Solibacterales bacterium]|nr:hypothetical protein [Bryobacterales bacterium]